MGLSHALITSHRERLQDSRQGKREVILFTRSINIENHHLSLEGLKLSNDGMNDDFWYDIFLCHNRADKPWVHRLAQMIETEEYCGRTLRRCKLGNIVPEFFSILLMYYLQGKHPQQAQHKTAGAS